MTERRENKAKLAALKAAVAEVSSSSEPASAE
jgi:hypothetical protein